jgi:hypothetical protein
MDIVIGRTTYVNRDGAQNEGSSNTARKKKNKNRRKNNQDRRKSVRDGVIVTLSTKKDRRNHKDRRKQNPV